MPNFPEFCKQILNLGPKPAWHKLLAIALASGLLGGVSGCASHQTNQTTIRFSTWGSSEELAQTKSLIAEFEKLYPNIHIELVHIPENYFQKLHILIAGGLTPDVMFINSLNFPVYADSNIFEPLEPFLKETKSGLEADGFFEAPLKAFTWKNHIYAMPRDVSDLVVFYNCSMFQKQGVAEPTASWTLEDMLKKAKALTVDKNHDGHIEQFGLSFFSKPPFLWLPFVWSEKGNLFDDDFSKILIDSPEAIKGIQFYADLRNKWHVAPAKTDIGSATMSQLFLDQKLAMLVSGRWSVPLLREQAKFSWDVAPFPKGKSGSVVSIDASGYAIARNSEHKKEGWAFVAFLSSRHAQEVFTKSGLIVPARKDVASSKTFLRPPPRHGQYFIDAMATGVPTHTPPRWNEIAEELNLTLEPVFDGTQTAESALHDVKPKLEKLLP